MQRNSAFFIFLTCILVEPLLLTVWSGKLGHTFAPILWLIIALIPAFILLKNKGIGLDVQVIKQTESHQNALYAWTIFGLGLLICTIALSKIFANNVISPTSSDIVPSIIMYVERFLAGTDPYAPMQFPSWVVTPNYFPLRWLPFIPAAWLHIDYRWIGFIALCGTFWYYTKQSIKLHFSLRQISLRSSAPWLMLFAFIHFDPSAWGNAVESLIAAFYLTLAFTLFTRPRWMALGIILCLLSRISFTFWLPAYGLMILMHYGWKPALRIAAYVLLAVLLIYVVPFILPDGGKTFLEGLKYYEACAYGEWFRQGWQEVGAIPTHLSRGIGFAYFWYKGEGTEAVQYAACSRFFQMITLATAGALLIGYFVYRKRGLNMRIYGLVSLKIYLTVFYAFFPIPYHYLFLTPCLLSLPLLYFYRSE